MGSESPVRWTVHFSGRVQGVGFRFTTMRVARGFAVTGYVRNQPDGRVELVAEGAPAEVARFVEAVEETMADHITDRARQESPGTGEFPAFDVRT